VQNIAKKLCDDSIEQGTLEAIDDEKQRAILELFAKALQLEENLLNRAGNSPPTIGNVEHTSHSKMDFINGATISNAPSYTGESDAAMVHVRQQLKPIFQRSAQEFDADITHSSLMAVLMRETIMTTISL
jgi:hypothetical protein